MRAKQWFLSALSPIRRRDTTVKAPATWLALALAMLLAVGVSFQPAPPPAHAGAPAQAGAPAEAQGPAGEPNPLDRTAPQVLNLAGNAFTYQGFLMDGGSPATGVYDFSFGIYADAAGTEWVASAAVIEDESVVDGLFTVAPDFTVPGYGDIHFFFNGETRYLRIGVRPGASTGAFTFLTPLQPLTPVPYAQALPGLHTIQNDTSPNVVGGYPWNSVGLGYVGATISGGGQEAQANAVQGDFGTVGGGRINTAGADDATVGGGASNTASEGDATVGGGEGNTAGGLCAVVAGGCGNVADNTLATVGGGDVNYATAERATIAGGSGNTASGPVSAIGGGGFNQATADYATVGGGGGDSAAAGNRATDPYATVGGGRGNHAGNGNLVMDDAHYATVGGGFENQASNVYATVGGGEWNVATGIFSTIAGGQANTATGGVATVCGGSNNESTGNSSIVAGGLLNIAGADWATVSGGQHNEVSGDFSTIGGGGSMLAAEGNTITNEYSTIAGGTANSVSGNYATIGGGDNNTAGGSRATIGGGSTNTANGNYTAIGGGYSNEASGMYGTVPGGNRNLAQGTYSFAAGRQAKAYNDGCFVWGDNSTTSDITCNTDNRWVARTTGGVEFYTNTALTSGVRVAAGGSSWAAVSDRTLKENVEAVDYVALLERLAAEVPVTSWNYKAQEDSIRHIGPMAQDLYQAFRLGEDEQHITTVDADGLALAAIQGLYQLVQDQEQQITELEARIAALEQGDAARRPAPAGPVPGALLLGGLVLGGGLVLLRNRSGRER